MIESRQMEAQKTSPVMNRFSIVTALLALFLTILFFLPAELASFPIRIATTVFYFSTAQLIPFLIAGIGLIGSYWILSAHPNVERKGLYLKEVVPNTILPTITILIFALILLQTDKGLTWWGILLMGLLAFVAVFYAEYQVLKPEIGANTIFTILLIALAHGLFMAFAIALRASVMRIFLISPAIMFAAGFVAYRTLFLRSEGNLRTNWVIIVIFVVTQFCVAFYYLFITPNQFGLFLTAVLFTTNALTARIGQGDHKHLYVEPIALVAFIVLFMLLSSWV